MTRWPLHFSAGPLLLRFDSLGPIPIGLGAAADPFCAAKAGADPPSLAGRRRSRGVGYRVDDRTRVQVGLGLLERAGASGRSAVAAMTSEEGWKETRPFFSERWPSPAGT